MKSKEQSPLTRQEILRTLRNHRDALVKLKVKRIGLFGSFAAGKQRKRSDIDFLVEFLEPTFDNFMGLHARLRRLFGRKIDLITPIGLSVYIRPFVEKEVRWYEVK